MCPFGALPINGLRCVAFGSRHCIAQAAARVGASLLFKAEGSSTVCKDCLVFPCSLINDTGLIHHPAVTQYAFHIGDQPCQGTDLGEARHRPRPGGAVWGRDALEGGRGCSSRQAVHSLQLRSPRPIRVPGAGVSAGVPSTGFWESCNIGRLSPLFRGCEAGCGSRAVCPEDHREGPCAHRPCGPLGWPLTSRPLCPQPARATARKHRTTWMSSSWPWPGTAWTSPGARSSTGTWSGRCPPASQLIPPEPHFCPTQGGGRVKGLGADGVPRATDGPLPACCGPGGWGGQGTCWGLLAHGPQGGLVAPGGPEPARRDRSWGAPRAPAPTHSACLPHLGVSRGGPSPVTWRR